MHIGVIKIYFLEYAQTYWCDSLMLFVSVHDVCVLCLFKEAFVDRDPGGCNLQWGQNSVLRV